MTAAAQESRVRASGAEFFSTKRLANCGEAVQKAADSPATFEAVAEIFFRGRVTTEARAGGDGRQDRLSGGRRAPYGGTALYELGEVPLSATIEVVPMYVPGSKHKSLSAVRALMTSTELALPHINRERDNTLGLGPLASADTDGFQPQPLTAYPGLQPAAGIWR